ncbi:DUF2188 domain-containing protein [Anaeromyxobacter sp. PSR-1]|uniref:DUF2188 domain-containing protein n=1 Tax=Anaeromyxobacter sp. PSR-1 TaxID=1300915 RepID=UPI0005E5F344|nr:DUF2188 domain-containing protein [Anaeromyxobacter sp. PSR-1]GAO01831.1 hypothetical protein PSR1_00692 [Anaeromyxobacter sp. PSR-1]
MARSGKGGTSGAVHTVPSGSGWANKQNGKVLSEHHKKANAEEAGRKQAIQRETEHVIHKKDGEIGERNSYGNDPPERKG